jgi:hypothetical protein
MSLKVIARHRAASAMKKTKIATFDEWMAMRDSEGLDEDEIIDGSEPEGKEEDLPEEEEPLQANRRKRRRIDPPHTVCVTPFPSCCFR